MSREVLRDALIYLPAKVIPAAVGVVSIPILTRLLTPSEYGHYLLSLTSLTLICAMCASWLVSITLRFQVVYGAVQLYRTSRPLLLWAVLAGCALWVVVVILLQHQHPAGAYLAAGLLWIGAYTGFEYFAGWLRACNRAAAFSLAVCWRSLAGLALAIALLLMGIRTGWAVILAAAVAMAAALLLLPRAALQARAEQDSAAADDADVRQAVLRYGMPAALSNVAIVGLSMADRYLVGGYLGTEAVAVYGASYDLAEKTVFFVNSMLLLSSSVIGFRIFEKEGEVRAADFLRSLLRLYLMTAPLLVLGIWVLAPVIVGTLLPAGYSEGVDVLRIVSCAGLLVGIMHRYSLLLSFHRRTDTILWCSGAALLVNIAVCWALVPHWRLVGAALATVLAYGSWLLFIRLAARRYRCPRFPWPTVLRVALACALAGTAMQFLLDAPQAPGLAMGAGAFVGGAATFVLALLLLGEVSAKELQATRDALQARLRKTGK